jgi:hypothetical protein
MENIECLNELVSLFDTKQKEHNHIDEWKFCKDCCNINKKLLKMKQCLNCGNYDDHTKENLCSTCNNVTKKCDDCSNRTRKYLKHCQECSDNTICEYIGCTEKNCLVHKCKKCNFIAEHEYCNSCQCEVKYCEKEKIRKYCQGHGCNYKNCKILKYEMSNYCEKHKCKYCREKVFKNDGCENHVCRKCETLSYHPYCELHRCEKYLCKNMSYKDKDKCLEHACLIKGCENNSDSYKYKTLFCYDHSKNYVNCSKKAYIHNDAFRPWMKFAELIKADNIDISFLWAKISNRIQDNFSTTFLKCSFSLFYSLKQYQVPKDIRKIIFYEYLKKNILYFFEEKCYDCAKICDKEKCGYVDFPYNKKCETHACKIKDCENLKYLEISICLEHKCLSCMEEKLYKTDYCRKHLCPFCMEQQVSNNSNFCKNCRCEYESCENAKYLNNTVCKYHL